MKNKRIIMMLLLIIIMLGLSTVSNAVYESRPGKTRYIETVDGHFKNIRAMEKSGGTLGLNAAIDETTYLDTTKNGLDIHMVLPTEWGTAAMLAVSDYGAFNTTGKLEDSGTTNAATTGNITGVFQMADTSHEFVVCLRKDYEYDAIQTVSAADSRYRMEYVGNNTEYHKGDAMYQCNGWYGASEGRNFGADSTLNHCVIVRSRSSLFGYVPVDATKWYDVGTRAAITCAEGL